VTSGRRRFGGLLHALESRLSHVRFAVRAAWGALMTNRTLATMADTTSTLQ
jgi:hypothetical protein